VFSVDSSGAAAVHLHNRAADTWTRIVSPRKDAAIRTGLGAENRLRLVVDSAQSSFHVNDSVFGPVPNAIIGGAKQLRIAAASDNSAASTWTIDDLIVSAPSAPGAAVEAGGAAPSSGSESSEAAELPPAANGAFNSKEVDDFFEGGLPDAGTEEFGSGEPDQGGAAPALSEKESAVYKDLLASKLAIDGFSVIRATGNARPSAGVAELDYDLQATDSTATGQAMYRFYGSESEAAAYFQDGGGSSFAGDAKAAWGVEVHTGRLDDPVDVIHVVWAIDAERGAELIRLGTQDADVVAMLSLTIPRPGVQPTDSLSQETIDAGANAIDQLMEDEIEFALKHASRDGGSGGEGSAFASASP
jgi:hypothetical protein